MFCAINVNVMLFLLVFAAMGSEDIFANDNKLLNQLGIQKKYKLIDCMVQMDLLWGSDVDYSTRRQIYDGVNAPMLKAMRSEEFPFFTARWSRTGDNYIFYFIENCEDRLEYVRKLVEQNFLPNIPNFPRYELKHDNIDYEFDGATPSCCWLDD